MFHPLFSCSPCACCALLPSTEWREECSASQRFTARQMASTNGCPTLPNRLRSGDTRKNRCKCRARSEWWPMPCRQPKQDDCSERALHSMMPLLIMVRASLAGILVACSILWSPCIPMAARPTGPAPPAHPASVAHAPPPLDSARYPK